jgi:hypothetical protein
MQADTVVPGAGNPQALNRFSYAYGNPIKYTDPSGHCGIIASILGFLGFASCPADPGSNVISDPLCTDCAAKPLITTPCTDCAAQPLITTPCADCAAQPLITTPCELCGAQVIADPPAEGLGSTVYASNGDAKSRLPLDDGGKVKGIFDSGSAERDIVSGWPKGDEVLPIGAPGYRHYVRDHVEGHVSAIMRNNDIMEADLYINRTPCPGPGGCDEMLPHMLPEGATLRVHIKLGVDDWEDRIYYGEPDSAYGGS